MAREAPLLVATLQEFAAGRLRTEGGRVVDVSGAAVGPATSLARWMPSLLPAALSLVTEAALFGRLVRWDRWANRTVLEVLRGSGGEPANALAAFQHVCEGEMTWLGRIVDAPNPNVPLWGEASLGQVESWLPVIEARLEIAVAEVDANGAERIVEYTNSRGDAFTSSVEEMLTHMLLHSTQYRGEAAAFLNGAGHRVPDLDYIFWLRDGEPA